MVNGEFGQIEISVCNNNPAPVGLAAYKVRPQLSTNNLMEITGVTDLPTGWFICSLGAGPGNTIRLSNGTDNGLLDGECRTFFIDYKAVGIGLNSLISATLGFGSGTVAGACTGPGGQTVGNLPGNDNGQTSVTVTAMVPINLLSFTAKKVNNEEVMLNWETATEENFKGFDVEASIDGSKFAKIGYVEGRGSNSKYVMMDRNPFQGVNYYRLKSVDVDGSFVYSDIKAVEITERSKRELAVFPNPFNGGFTLSGLKPGSEIKIHDIKGSVVYTNKTDDSVFRVNVPSLVGGVYNVSVTNSGETISKRLIKID